ncbi:MAG TPA: archaeosine biosynthesis radical SAM protein RaSEA [Methanomassiliicoccales archaeon]|nr:archaeosine biosynthesis radical SAM protein RaSEA [Methanomassiliicoccales archaeon]
MKNLDLNRPVTIWKEDDVVDGKKEKALVAIFRTRGCHWSRKCGCSMCGYNVESLEGIGVPELTAQLEAVLSRYEGEGMVKLYTSGSFLDPMEIPEEVRDRILSSFDNAKQVLFESRPEFVTPETLQHLPDHSAVALGLESASDKVLRCSVRKGFGTKDYLRAAEAVNSRGFPVRTYLLLKPPYLTESAAIDDTLRSVKFAAPYSDSISINPLNVQKETLVEGLWRRGDYRPPWIWSLFEVLKSKAELPGVRLFSSPSGAGTQRGVHNCPDCDRRLLDILEKFNFEQDVELLGGHHCHCRKEWNSLVGLEELMRTSVDVSRHLGDELVL